MKTTPKIKTQQVSTECLTPKAGLSAEETQALCPAAGTPETSPACLFPFGVHGPEVKSSASMLLGCQ